MKQFTARAYSLLVMPNSSRSVGASTESAMRFT